jgi:hypothetical protein
MQLCTLVYILRISAFSLVLGIQILTIRYFNGFAVFLGHPVERLHSFPRDQLNKSHGGHVGVPDKRV